MEGPNAARTFSLDMIHSEEEVKHALHHLMQGDDDYLKGNETLTMYRNVRSKYVSDEYMKEHQLQNGHKQICAFRTVEQGLLAAYQASVCPASERPASTIYVNINPRDVPAALKVTHSLYYQWLEHKVGTSKQQVRKGSRQDFAGTLNRVFDSQVSGHKSRGMFQFIDVDDDDPDTWLTRIREAIGEEAIEMIIETKNGFHVVYQNKKMPKEAHSALREVLDSDTETGKDASVTKAAGCALACALPGAYQGGHKVRTVYCSCNKSIEKKCS